MNDILQPAERPRDQYRERDCWLASGAWLLRWRQARDRWVDAGRVATGWRREHVHKNSDALPRTWERFRIWFNRREFALLPYDSAPFPMSSWGWKIR